MEKRIKAYIQLTEEWLQTKEALSQQEREDFQAWISGAPFLLSAWAHGASSGDDPVCHSCLSVHWDRDCWRISGYVSGYGNVIYFADSIYPALLFSGEHGAENVWFVWQDLIYRTTTDNDWFSILENDSKKYDKEKSK